MLKASDVATRFRKITPIDRLRKDVLTNINRTINQKTREGQISIRYVLPKRFNSIGDLSCSEIRALVYAGVIKQLEELEYIVRFKVEDDKPVLIISTGIDLAKKLDVASAKEYIRRHVKVEKPPKQSQSQPQSTPNKPQILPPRQQLGVQHTGRIESDADAEFMFSTSHDDVFDILNEMNN